jgi:hypothetical protein
MKGNASPLYRATEPATDDKKLPEGFDAVITIDEAVKVAAIDEAWAVAINNKMKRRPRHLHKNKDIGILIVRHAFNGQNAHTNQWPLEERPPAGIPGSVEFRHKMRSGWTGQFGLALIFLEDAEKTGNSIWSWRSAKLLLI